MGGTFDPVHVGHVLLALAAMERLPLDQVLFVPAADPPHKDDRIDMAPAADRCAMVELAIADFPGFALSRVELERPGKSYTVDTLRQLKDAWPGWDLVMIIGDDNVAQLPSWYDPHGILALCTVVAGSRMAADPGRDNPLASQVRSLDTPVYEVSSTTIRHRLRHGQTVRYLVPDPVLQYIHARGLYGAGTAAAFTLAS
jgi:nicotinate-nucleotide adenylyltransferase